MNMPRPSPRHFRHVITGVLHWWQVGRDILGLRSVDVASTVPGRAAAAVPFVGYAWVSRCRGMQAPGAAGGPVPRHQSLVKAGTAGAARGELLHHGPPGLGCAKRRGTAVPVPYATVKGCPSTWSARAARPARRCTRRTRCARCARSLGAVSGASIAAATGTNRRPSSCAGRTSRPGVPPVATPLLRTPVGRWAVEGCRLCTPSSKNSGS